MNIDEIKIEEVKEIIPSILYAKLVQLNIEKLAEIAELDLLNFSKRKGVGKKAVKQLHEFQNWLRHNKNDVVNIRTVQKMSIIELPVDSNIGKIAFRNIEELVPGKLYSKFLMHNIDTVDDLSQMSIEEFKKLRSVGKGTVELLTGFIAKLKSNPSDYLRLHKIKTEGVSIPRQFNINDSFLLLFRNLTNDYVDLVKDHASRSIDFLIRYHGLGNSSKYTLAEIGLYYDISRERVRQVLVDLIVDLQGILSGQESKFLKIRCHQEVQRKIVLFMDRIKALRVVSDIQLIKIFKREIGCELKKDMKPYLDLLFEIYNIRQSGHVESSFSEATIYFTDGDIDKDRFFYTGKVIFDVLEKEINLISIFDLIISIKKIEKKINKDYVHLCLKCFPEIEEIIDDGGQELYQIRLDKLSSSADMAERILLERGKSTHIDDLVNEVNRRLYLLGSDKKVSKTSVLSQLKNKDHIVYKGKTGIYSFADWEENTENISDIIRKAFLYYNNPLSPKEIVEFVKELRPLVKENSVRTITNLDFIRLNDNKYILPEWANRYKGEIYKKNLSDSKPRHYYAIKILKEQPSCEMEKKVLIKILEKEYNFPKSIAYATLGRKKYFHGFENDKGKKVVKLVEQKIESFKRPIKEKLLVEIQDFLQSIEQKECRLRDLIRRFETNKNYKRQMVYKIINENKNDFIKIERNGDLWVMSKNGITNRLNPMYSDWEEIKIELSHDLSNYFNDPRQPKYPIDFPKALDLFKDVLDFNTGESGLDGLKEQLLPTLLKYYKSSNDKSDLLNHFKQISTSLDPFLKKILFLIDVVEYNKIKTSRAGLGTVIKALNKLDPKESRYMKNIKDVPIFKFGKQMFSAYSARNSLTHEAKFLGKQQIISNTTNTIIIYIYSIFEYYKEIEIKLNK